MMRVRSKSFGSRVCVGMVGFVILVLVSCVDCGLDVFFGECFLDVVDDFLG